MKKTIEGKEYELIEVKESGCSACPFNSETVEGHEEKSNRNRLCVQEAGNDCLDPNDTTPNSLIWKEVSNDNS